MADRNTPEESKLQQKQVQNASLEMIAYQLAGLIESVDEINDKFDVKEREHVEFLIWKEKLEGRLTDGNRKMSEADKKIEVSEEHCRGEFKAMAKAFKETQELMERNLDFARKEIRKEIQEFKNEVAEEQLNKRYVRKDMVKWIAIGFMAAGGGGAAFGHLIAKAMGF